ncbi:hypothetical protein WL278_01305 [Staphylococcus caprae]|uniref:hypothetical protein n=1 Tax=Staphylococcus TaxID=1279 RepID=UPI0008A9C665|nr:hypothetical protein [Staphylococcus sp. HMSC62A08]OHS39201.1 hypothetical protein HMPREF3264_04740 [Staphylococcus sp. HMSC62A08]
MFKFKLKASLLLDGLLAFFIIGIITLIFVPSLSSFNQTYQLDLKTLEIKKIILTSISHFNENQLKQGIVIEKYEIQLSHDKICGKDKEFKIETCVSL